LSTLINKKNKMACNCNKCNPSKPCGCTDVALSNPCSYSDCSVGSERCAEISCTECISYCGTTFQVGTAGSIIKIETGERLDSIIQKMALMISQGVGACTSDDLHHAPYNVYAANVTSNSAVILWNNESTATDQIEVFLDSGLAISSLTAATDYKVKLVSTDSLAATCDSVEILFTTLL